MLRDLSLDVITAEIPLDDGSVRAEEYDMRDAVNPVNIGRNPLGVNNLVPDDSLLLGGFDSVLFLIPDSHAENVELGTSVLLLDILDIRHLSLARTAP